MSDFFHTRGKPPKGISFSPGMTEAQKLAHVMRVLEASGWKMFHPMAEHVILSVALRKDTFIQADVADVIEPHPLWGQAAKDYFNKIVTQGSEMKSWTQGAIAPVMNKLKRKGVLLSLGTTKERRSQGGYTTLWKLNPEHRQRITEERKEEKMAAKKKTEQKSDDPRAWHKKAMSVFMEQVGDGKGLDGYTFAEIRKIMGLTDPKEPGYNEVALAITELRNEGFLAHKFAHPSLKEDFFEGDPQTDIPNIQKRENEQKLKQLVFFVHPAALALGDDVLAAVEAGEYPEDHEYDTNSTVFDRDQVYAWFDGLGEIIDLYVTDEEQKATSAKLIAALMPAKSE